MLVINNNQTLVPYHPPAPPIGSGYHRYQFRLFEQPNHFTDLKLPTENKQIIRPKFNHDKFSSEHQLEELSLVTFKTQR